MVEDVWCAREDLNLHPLRDQILSLARLPFRHSRKRRGRECHVCARSQAVIRQDFIAANTNKFR